MSAIQLASDTLTGTPSPGAIEYNGQFYGTDSNSSRGIMQRLVAGTAVNSTSGTSIDFTGIPAWAKRVTVMFNGVSTSGTSIVLIQVGAGSVVTTGYLGASGNSAAQALYTAGFGLQSASAASVRHGALTLSLLGSNTWVANGSFSQSDAAQFIVTAGSISLSGTLDRVRITTVNGTDTFDAGSINILIEG